MTGDGVNDRKRCVRPALASRWALVGTGSPRMPPTMVLTDDDFATIEAAVEKAAAYSTI